MQVALPPLRLELRGTAKYSELMPFDLGYAGKALVNGLAAMVSGAYLRRQAESLIAMSRATFDLTIAGRLRRMAAELQVKAAEQDESAFTEHTLTNCKRSARM